MFLIFSCDRENEKLEIIIQEYQNHEAYDYKDYPLGNFSEEHFRSEKEFAENLLVKLSYIDVKKLDENDNISFELLSFVLEDIVAYYDFERFLNPLLSDSGFHSSLVYNVRPMYNYNQIKNYINKLNSIPQYVDQYLPLLRKGLKKGVSQPLIIFDGYESTYNDHITKDFELNYFYSPFKTLPNGLSQTQKDSVLIEAKKAIEKSVVPQFIRIKDFFEKEYYPNTRTTVGVSEIPNGAEFYQNRINYYTTSTLYSADEIHQIGLKEVKRIRDEMDDVIESVSWKGTFKGFLNDLRTNPKFYFDNPDDLFKEYLATSKRLDPELVNLFKVLPSIPYGIKPIPEESAPDTTTAYYQRPAADGSRAGYYYVNLYRPEVRPKYEIEVLSVHEAVPGHHLQIALAMELDLPNFRKYGGFTAFVEGWGLYSESLGYDMGLYKDPYSKFGQLTYDMWRAIRLVVDTGMHYMDWSRQDAINYFLDNSAKTQQDIINEVDRYINWPGQALAYKIGQLKILELKNRSKEKLGDLYDVKDFHHEVLKRGAIPLYMLEENIDAWIEDTLNL